MRRYFENLHREHPYLIVLLIILILILFGLVSLSFAEKPEAAFELKGDADKGLVVYQRYCLGCHGEKGDGHGPAAHSLKPLPADYTKLDFLMKYSDEDLYTIVRDGGTAVKKSALMISWKKILTDQEIHDVVKYIKTFARSLG